jgi:hypothetical protein
VSVIKSDRFEREFRSLLADLPRLDEAIGYVEYQLSEDPASGLKTAVSGLFIARTRLPHDGGMIRVSIFYLFDGTNVTFVDLKRDPTT